MVNALDCVNERARARVVFWECVNLVQLCECAFNFIIEDSFHSINEIFHSIPCFNNSIFPAKNKDNSEEQSTKFTATQKLCLCERRPSSRYKAVD